MDQQANSDQSQEHGSRHIGRTLMWIGIGSVGAAALTFVVVRTLMSRRPSDPTSERIQQLIDEANHLLKALDEQRTA